jgi:molecular chaperone DnaK (HSP70)
MPSKVRALLERFFGKPVNTKLNPDEAARPYLVLAP